MHGLYVEEQGKALHTEVVVGLFLSLDNSIRPVSPFYPSISRGNPSGHSREKSTVEVRKPCWSKTLDLSESPTLTFDFPRTIRTARVIIHDLRLRMCRVPLSVAADIHHLVPRQLLYPFESAFFQPTSSHTTPPTGLTTTKGYVVFVQDS